MLVGELLEFIKDNHIPPDAHVNTYVDQDMQITSDAWSGPVEAHLTEYFEVAELVAETEWDGPHKAPCLTIVTGKAVS